MKHSAERIETGFGYCFGERWMSVNREIDFFDGELVLPRNSELVQQFGRVRADYVRTEYFAVFRIAYDLDEAFGLA